MPFGDVFCCVEVEDTAAEVEDEDAGEVEDAAEEVEPAEKPAEKPAEAAAAAFVILFSFSSAPVCFQKKVE